MHHFTIQFTYPWLLLLLIPAAALTVFLYLRLNKKFRRNRNRIVSVVLHSIVMVLCIFTLSGMTFRYEVNNSDNELILLVDVSDTTEDNVQRRSDFVESVLTESQYEGCRVGVVTFGFTQQNAAPLSFDADSAYELYLNAELPDTSATDIAAALQFAHTLFEHPETGKIVLISDGKQTDEEAISVIRSIAAQGVIVDTVYFPSEYANEAVQISGIALPEYYVRVGESFSVDVQVESKIALTGVTVELYDNGDGGPAEEDNSVTVDLNVGSQVIHFTHTFKEQGLHELCATLQYRNEALEQNNTYYAYRWLQVHNKLLILEQGDQSARLVEALKEDDVEYEIGGVNIATGQGFSAAGQDGVKAVDVPASVEELRAYDQVILNNISSKDLEEKGLDALLYDYVYNYGGGLFTTGGTEADGVTAHSYNRSDMNNTLYQQMLPVQVINYTPPVAVFVVIDISGSMLGASTGGRTKLEWAKQGAIECLNALTERDYIGIMTMDTEYGMVLDLTPCTQDGLIREKILGVGEGQSTIYSTAIDRAAQRLANLENVDKRHIILVTDGAPSSEDRAAYLQNTADAYNNHGITLSVVGIGVGEGSDEARNMLELTGENYGHGRFTNISEGGELLAALRDELNVPEIEETKYGDFNPAAPNVLSPLLNGVNLQEDSGAKHLIDVQLGGFFGTKARNHAEIVLVGEYDVPIYAQWAFGNGMVGSFMCDVYGEWSTQFMENDNGKRFLRNAVANLMPMEDIRPTSVTLDLREDNYINRLNVYSSLENGEHLEGTLAVQTEEGEVTYSLNALSEQQDGDVYVTTALGSDNNYSRAEFVIKQGGVYTITVNRCDAAGNVLETVSLYKAFSYSAEYDFAAEQDPDPEALMAQIAERGNGSVIAEEDFWEIFATFVTDLERVFDPRWLFIGLAMAFFLLDIAVRKFKFKWLHEIIREHKEKKAGKL